MERQELLSRIRERLAPVYGERLQGVVMYGSEARGDAGPGSDIDVLILLDAPAESWEDVHSASEALFGLMLELGRIIDAMPVDVRRYEEADAPLYAAARREGIRR